MNIIRVTNPSLTGLGMKDFNDADMIFYRPDKVWWKPWQRPSILMNKSGKTGKCSFDELNRLIRASGNSTISVCQTTE